MMIREPSVRVRENAADQLEERQSDWGYSKPIVAIDFLLNLAFVIITVGVLGLSSEENPKMPLRVWVVGYGLQCLRHVVCVVVEYRKRRNMGFRESGILSSDSGDSLDFGSQQSGNDGENTRLCIAFLAVDARFVIICVSVACLIGIAVCCCLPCIIGILYAMADQEGATREEIDRLLKYKFHRTGDYEKVNGEIQESLGGMMTECDTDTPNERAFCHEDAECCICLSAYEDGSELRELPCNHHFHCMCIDKWLCINATCPLCKFNILKVDSQSGSEEA